MAEELSIIIGADVEDAKAGIKSVTDVLNDFGRQGKLSIAAVERSMVELRQTIKTTSDPTEVAKLKQAYSELGLKLQQLKISGGLESQLNGVSRSTRIAHSELDGIALSLRGVATGSERGVDALSNIAFRFEQLRGETGGVKAALAALGESFLGPAGLVLGLTTVIALLGPFIEKLFSAEDAEKANKKALDDLSGSIKQVKEDSDNLTTSLNFLNKLGSINIKIFGQGNLEDLRQQSAANQQLVVNLAEETNKALKNLNDAQLQNEKQKSKESQKVLDEALQGLKDAQKKEAEARDNGRIIFRQIELQKVEDQKDVNKKLQEELKKQEDIINAATIKIAERASEFFNIPLGLKFSIDDTDLEKLTKAKAILDGIHSHEIRLNIIVPEDIKLPTVKLEIDKAEFKKSVDSLISLAIVPLKVALDKTTLSETEQGIEGIFNDFLNNNIFGNVGRKSGEDFRKALLDSIAELRKGFLINPEIDTADLINSISKTFAGVKQATSEVIKTEDFKGILKTLEELGIAGKAAGEATREAFLAAGRSSEDAAAAAKVVVDAYGGISKETATIAEVLDSTLTPAFQGLFDAIIKGKDPLKALFGGLITAVEQLIAKLIAAKIQAIILKAISNSIPNPLSLLSLVGGFFAEGGRPPVGKPSIVGEKGWEIFVPDKPGTIISHHESVKLANEYVSQSSVDKNNSVREYFVSRTIADTMKAAEARLHEFVTKIADHTERITNNISARVDNYTKAFSDTIRTTNNNLLERISTHTQAVDKFVRSSSSDKAFSYQFIEAIKEKLSDSKSNIRIEKLYNKYIADNIQTLLTGSIPSQRYDINSILIYIFNKHKNVNEKYNTIVSDVKSFISSTSDSLRVNNKIFSNNNQSEYEKQFSQFSDTSSNKETSFVSIIKNILSSISEKISDRGDRSFYKITDSIRTVISGLESLREKSSVSDRTNYYEKQITDTASNMHSRASEIKSHFTKAFESLKETASDKKSIISKSSDYKDHYHNSKEKSIVSHFESISTSVKLLSESVKNLITTGFSKRVLQIESESKSERITLDRFQKMFNIPAFAEGGAVFGPTLAILGEGFGISKSNPELVGTANQLKGIMGGAFDLNLTISGQVRHSGNDLLYAINQAMKTTLRTTGRTGL